MENKEKGAGSGKTTAFLAGAIAGAVAGAATLFLADRKNRARTISKAREMSDKAVLLMNTGRDQAQYRAAQVMHDVKKGRAKGEEKVDELKEEAREELGKELDN